jgi:hypothetical protein
MKTPFTSRLVSLLTPVRCLGLLAVASLGFAHNAAAQTTPPVRITQVDATNFRLRIDNPTKQRSQLTVVRQASGQVLHTAAYRDAAYGCRLDFGKLPDGQYSITLKAGPERYRYTIHVQNHGATAAVREMATRQTQNLLATAEQ